MSKENIVDLFYSEHLSVKDIALKLNVSSPYITKVIKQDERYTKEKEDRRKQAKDKRKKEQNKFIKNKREWQRCEDNYSFVKAQHNQDVRVLSKSSHLSNESYRRWNYSAYSYNPSKKRYEFDSSLGRAADVPQYIKDR